MTYREYTNQWIVVRMLPSSQRIVLGRYRKRFLRRASLADAEGHLAVMRQQMPRGNFAIAFDVPESVRQ